MHAAVLMLALTAPSQHPIKLDATLLWHELKLFGDGYQRGCGPDCYRCRGCNGLGRCYDYRREFGYPWQPRTSSCAVQKGWAASAPPAMYPTPAEMYPGYSTTPPPRAPANLPPPLPQPIYPPD